MHEDFLQAVLAHPDEEAPRLIYADWLEEQGEADRAEFIRLQCELPRIPYDEARRVQVVRRLIELKRQHYDTWLHRLIPGPVPLGTEIGFVGGFVE